jgi:hypothetical protein
VDHWQIVGEREAIERDFTRMAAIEAFAMDPDRFDAMAAIHGRPHRLRIKRRAKGTPKCPIAHFKGQRLDGVKSTSRIGA